MAVRREGAMSAHTYRVTVEREGRWWVFDIPELGTGGQAQSLAAVEFEAHDVAAMWLGVAPETIAVTVDVTVPAEALAEWRAAEKDEEAAREAQARAAARRRAVVQGLRAQRISAADVGQLLGITRQRVYQIDVSDPPVSMSTKNRR